MEQTPAPQPAEPKKEQLSPEREAQEIRLKDIEIQQKTHDLDNSKKMSELEAKYRELENRQMEEGEGGWNCSLDKLLNVAKAWCIDNERTVLSDPVLKCIWTDDEMEEIKSLIMKKARKL